MSYKIYYLIVVLFIVSCQPQIVFNSMIITYENIIATDMNHLNIFNKEPIYLLSSTKIGERTYSMEVKGNILFTASESKGIRSYNISNPSKPILISSYKTGGNARKIILRGKHLFVANSSKKILILNIGDPEKPKLISELTLMNNPSISDIKFENDLLYVSLFKQGVVLINVKDPPNPQIIGDYYIGTGGKKASERFGEISIKNKIVYLKAQLQNKQVVLRVLDFANPAQPSLIKEIEIENYLFYSTIKDTILYLVRNNALSLFSIMNPKSPELIGDFHIPNIDLVDLTNDTLYVATLDLKIERYSFSDPRNPVHLFTFEYAKELR